MTARKGHPTTIVREALRDAGMRPLAPLGQRGDPWDVHVRTVHHDDGTATTFVEVHYSAGATFTPAASDAIDEVVRDLGCKRVEGEWDDGYLAPGEVVLSWPPRPARGQRS